FGFHALETLAKTPARPFAQGRDGINIGEGSGYLLLDRYATSPVYLAGVGESSDGYHLSSPDPEGRGARSAMQRALAQAGISPQHIDYINAHGTGTLQNDAVESLAI